MAERPIFFDGHNDVLTRLLDLPARAATEAFVQGDGKGHIDLPRMQQGNLRGGLFAMYVSSPVGYSDQADFINCVLALDVSVSAQDLFAQMQLIETALGRVRVQANQNAPRSIDIDLLMYGEHFIDEPDLVVPHPRMNQRLFVIEPLRQLGVRVEADQEIDFSDQHLHKLSI